MDAGRVQENLRFEQLLETWMRRLDWRLDRISEQLVSGYAPRHGDQHPLCERQTGAACPEPPRGTPPASPAKIDKSRAASLDSESRIGNEPVSDDVRPSATSVSSGISDSVKDLAATTTEEFQPHVAMRRSNTAERISQHWAMLEQSHGPGRNGSIIAKIVANKWFDWSMTAVVIFSAVMVGMQVDFETRHATSSTRYFDAAEYVCTVIFTVELVMRISAWGTARLCSSAERSLFIVDVALVATSWMEILVSLISAATGFGTTTPVGKIIKLFRIGRLMRIIRTVRIFTELRVMANMIWNSFRSLMWLFFILVGLGYCFALAIAQGAAMYLSTTEVDHATRAEMMDAFGSVLITMYSLFMSMTGGRNWGEIADIIAPAGMFYRGLVMLYIFLNLFSVLNIVTGVFVDGAIELGKRDRSMMIQKQGKKREAFAQHLVQLLRDMDTSGDGVITREEFLNSFSRQEVKEFMYALSIDLEDASNMFTLLDRNVDGNVDIVEFVMGMEKLRGEAKSSDIHFLILQCQHIMGMLTTAQGLQLEPVWVSSADVRHSSKERRASNRFSFRGIPGDGFDL